jgi:uncharacterized protein YgfB (UPF0149 family)
MPFISDAKLAELTELLDDNLTAWEGEEDSVKEEHEELITRLENFELQIVDDFDEAMRRADRLIQWMSKFIGQMAPGQYSDCYRELNEHGIFVAQHGLQGKLP